MQQSLARTTRPARPVSQTDITNVCVFPDSLFTGRDCENGRRNTLTENGGAKTGMQIKINVVVVGLLLLLFHVFLLLLLLLLFFFCCCCFFFCCCCLMGICMFSTSVGVNIVVDDAFVYFVVAVVVEVVLSLVSS